jgi:hypothetical protein
MFAHRYFDVVIRGAGRVCCWLRGHEMVRCFEPARLSLRCLHCGAETPGWTLAVHQPIRGASLARVIPFQRVLTSPRASDTAITSRGANAEAA